MLQAGSVSIIYPGDAQNTIAKNLWVVPGERGTTKRLLHENLSLCKRLLRCVSLLFAHVNMQP